MPGTGGSDTPYVVVERALMRRGLHALAVSSVVMLGSGLMAAAPAHAAAITVTDADCTAGVVNGANFSASTGDVVTITSNLSGCVTLKVGTRLVTSASDIVATGTGVGTPTSNGFEYVLTATTFTSIQITFTNTTSNLAGFGLGADDNASPGYGVRRTQWGVNYTGSGGGSSSSSSTSTPAPALETLTLAVSTGDTTCTGGSPTGYSGAWLQLPAADACSQSGPNANPNAKLLGWATDPIFPVAVAQQIVDLKYGPIDDYFYGMRMIFIPAGGWTFVSGSNNLYPIWSS